MARRSLPTVSLAGLAALALVAGGLDLLAREAYRRATDAEGREAARRRALPDANLLDLDDPALPRSALVGALALRPRDPRLLAALAARRDDPLDDDALRLALEAVRVAPHAAGVAHAVTERLLRAGEDLAARAVRAADTVRRAVASGRGDVAPLVEDAAHLRARARAVLDTVIAVDAGLSPTAPGRGPVGERAGLASRLRAELDEAP